MSTTFRSAPRACVVATAMAMLVHITSLSSAAEPDTRQLADRLRKLGAKVETSQLSSMVRDDLRKRISAANRASSRRWHKIDNRRQWEKFRDETRAALRRSLGDFPAPPKQLNVRVTGRIKGDGFTIENVGYESRPGWWVTGNLYLPAKPQAEMPGILLSHSHHRPKWQGELQDMGMTWARAGCVVLVPDHLGHGERRQHPFRTSSDYAESFRVSRQDYYFRYDTGIQLHLAGESLIGRLAWDLSRGVDLLLSREGVDPKKIILLGAVAGGGDPAAVAAALDGRIAAVVPFNFGGPQPETRYPLPADAETSLNYAGSGSWESTRNLRRSAADGFLPWVIVVGIAPRPLVYGHEFAWDGPRDPVWKRLQKIYGFYDATDRLAVAHGKGGLRGRPPRASHCNHIGAFHRKMIHPAFERWFGIKVRPQDEYSGRRKESELVCMTDAAKKQLDPQRLVDLLPELAAARMKRARKGRWGKSLAEERAQLRERWSRVLGRVEPSGKPTLVQNKIALEQVGDALLLRATLQVEPGIVVPVMLLTLSRAKGETPPVVIVLAQAGKQALLKHRADEIARLLVAGVAVCLPDLRGCGETAADRSRGPYSASTARSSTELMLGGTMVGAKLRDLRSVIRWLQGRKEVDGKRIALW
ncbi:MAG: acetylxylan esterase, partial [Planctomycetes bacterium]|nr:acetylxylan esterase [Planctomycetota bacterium]